MLGTRPGEVTDALGADTAAGGIPRRRRHRCPADRPGCEAEQGPAGRRAGQSGRWPGHRARTHPGPRLQALGDAGGEQPDRQQSHGKTLEGPPARGAAGGAGLAQLPGSGAGGALEEQSPPGPRGPTGTKTPRPPTRSPGACQPERRWRHREPHTAPWGAGRPGCGDPCGRTLSARPAARPLLGRVRRQAGTVTPWLSGHLRV